MFFFLHHPNNILSLQMREQGIYIYGLKCHIFNIIHKQLDLHVYILEASNAFCPKLNTGIISLLSRLHLVLSCLHRGSFNVWTRHPLKIRHIFQGATFDISQANRVCPLLSEIWTEGIFHILLYSRLTMNREISKRFIGLWSSKG